ncbi:MAG: hypothetical protein HQM10_08215 [Candidatus Riflebacteria bacterium]|nr:hypothetical protein [Candidatus Riflebacteria bacterium]
MKKNITIFVLIAFLFSLDVFCLAFQPEKVHSTNLAGESLRKSLLREIAKTILRSVEITLQEMKQPLIASRVSEIQIEKLSDSYSLRKISDFVERIVQNECASSSKLQISPEIISTAFDLTRKFLRLDERLLSEEFPFSDFSTEKKPGCDISASFSSEIENFNSFTYSVAWNEVEEYVDSRLGPLKELLKEFSSEDMVFLTNLPKEKVIPAFSGIASVTRFIIPLSSYGKEISVLFQNEGRKILLLSDFDSRAYLIHFGLLISRFRFNNNFHYKIFEHIDSEQLEKSYSQLIDFAEKNSDIFRNINSIVIGYSDEFKSSWGKYLQNSVVQNKNDPEKWEISVYKFPEGQSVGVLSGDVDYYGESLRFQLEKLISKYPVRSIFFGGSGGSLVPREPYSMYYPTTLESPNGCRTKNILTASDDAGSHISIDSPMFESPGEIAKMQLRGCCSIDMEAGHLAELSLKAGTEIGAAILITDFPYKYGSIDSSLAKQDFFRKIIARKDFVNKIENYVRKNKTSFYHQIEDVSGKSIKEVSRINLERLRREVGAISPLEKDFVDKLNSLQHRIVVRMSPGRLFWTLKDGALMSSRLVQLCNMKADPITPEIENQIFGGYDYIFAAYTFDAGKSNYGDVAVVLKPDSILHRSWGTRFSAWRVVNFFPGAQLDVHKQNVLKEVIHPHHYYEVLTLRAILRFRKLSEAEHKLINDTPKEKWHQFLFHLGIGYIELKIKTYVLRNEIERVILPSHAQGEIPGMLKKYSIPFTYYTPISIEE